MNCVPAYATIDKPKPRPPPAKVTVLDDLSYERACIEFLFACFKGMPDRAIKARAEWMRETKMHVEQR